MTKYCFGLLMCAVALLFCVPALGMPSMNHRMMNHIRMKCPGGDRLVTVNVKTRVYYARSDKKIITKSTMHMCERSAKAAGYHLSRSSMANAHKRMMKPNPGSKKMPKASGSQMNAPLPSASPTIQTNPDNEKNGIQTTPTPNPQPTRL